MSNNLTCISFAAGLGGMSKGAKIAGFSSIYQSDIWELTKKVFEFNKEQKILLPDNYCFSEGVYQAGEEGPNKINYGNMYNVRLETINNSLAKHGYSTLNLGDLALMTSGSPCQDMSRVNPYRHPSGTRNLLMVQQLRIVKKLMPMVTILEQVDSFFDAPMTPFKESFFRALRQIEGDYYWAYDILNAMDYGSRQNRKRVIFILIRKDLGVPSKFFPLPTTKPAQPCQFVNNLLPHIVGYTTKDGYKPANQVFGTMTSGLIRVLTTEGERRSMTIKERQVLCNLEDLNLDVPSVTETDKCEMLGNMVQIPLMADLCKHIRKEILKA